MGCTWIHRRSGPGGDLIGVGKSTTLKNFLAATDDPLMQRITAIASGRVPSAGIETSVTNPELLFRELDHKASKYGLRNKAAIVVSTL